MAKSKREIADKIGLKPALFSEILKGRSKLSGDLIQYFCKQYPDINPGYVLGLSLEVKRQKGAPMVDTPEPEAVKTHLDSIIDYLSTIKEVDPAALEMIRSEVEETQKENRSLKEQVKKLKAQGLQILERVKKLK